MKTKHSIKFEQDQISAIKAKKNLPAIKPGMQVKVMYNITDDGSSRLQAFEGLCISVTNNSLASSIVVRKLSAGKFGVDRIFKIYSPLVESIEVIRHGIIRRAKLYYLRDRIGRYAKLQEDFSALAKSKTEQKDGQ